MKHLTFLTCMSAILLSCNSTTNKASQNASEPQEIIQTQKELGYLTKYEGKYPRDVKILDSEPFHSRLQKLLGNKYSLFVKNLSTQSPITVQGENVFTSGCYPHSCTSDESALNVFTINDNILVGINSNSNLSVYSEKAVNPNNYPSEFKKWYERNGGQIQQN